MPKKAARSTSAKAAHKMFVKLTPGCRCTNGDEENIHTVD